MIDCGYGAVLGPLDKKYSVKIREWRNDYSIWRWCRQNDLISDQAQERWMQRQDEDPSIKMYSILVSGNIVGVCGLTSIDLYNRRAEFSIYIASEHQKKSYGKWALQTLIDHAFLNLNLNIVWGETVGENPAMEMFEKVGFQKEGVRREFYFKDGNYQDSTLFSIGLDRWIKFREMYTWEK